jgi:plastocyanin
MVALGWMMTASSSDAVEPALHQVTIERESYVFAPQTLSIHVGDTVRWTNRDGQEHMLVTAKPGAEGTALEIYTRLNPDTSPTFDHEFTIPTTYYYYCAIHFQMWGIIVVNP